MRSISFRVLSSLAFVLFAAQAFAQTRVITGAAGTGTAGYSGDSGPATAAKLNSPNDVTVDSTGDVYIADRNNNRVRKIDVSTGAITTVAGSGIAGWFFSGGPALFASLDHPSGVAVDSSGNLYIADLLENDISRIHKVTIANNRISRVDLPVLLKGAVAIALDSSGHLYIAEQAGHRIRKVTLSSGASTVIAGTGAPGFSGDGGPASSAAMNSPVNLAIDSAGNIYFADSVNNRIRKIAAGTGIITTVAGSGASGGPGGFSGDGGPATAAEFNNPRGVTVDGAGNIFIADTLNRRIRRVSAKTGIVTTIVSGDMTGEACAAASSSLRSPDSLSVNEAGTLLYIADDGGNRIWKVTLDPNSPPPTLTSIAPPTGVAGTTVVTRLAGSGFQGGAAASSGACSVNGTTIFVGGAGVTVAATTVTGDGAMQLTLNIAPEAEVGPHPVTVTTDSGTTAPVDFTVTLPAPAITSITPSSAARASIATVDLAGVNFVPGATNAAIEGITVAEVRVPNSAQMTLIFKLPGDVTLGPHNVVVTTPGGTSNPIPFTVLPEGPSFTYGLPPMLNPTQQTPIQVSLAAPLADPVTATINLTFTPNATTGSDDPNVTFVSTEKSTRSVEVSFPANTATANLSLPSGLLQAGTVAGTIELNATDVHVGGITATPGNTDFDVQVPRLAPVITSVRIINRSAAGFDVEITGYSTTRDITSATFNFGAASGAHLLTVELQPDVAASFGTYYQADTSMPAGGAFVYLQPFLVQQGDVNAVASVTVALANSVGKSESKMAR